MSDDTLLATMDELAGCLRLRDEHKTNIAEAQAALGKLEDEIVRLREDLAEHLRSYELERAPEYMPQHAPRDNSRARPFAVSPRTKEALETIKASGPAGVPGRALSYPGWVFGQLVRAQVARKLPNGNWVTA